MKFRNPFKRTKCNHDMEYLINYDMVKDRALILYTCKKCGSGTVKWYKPNFFSEDGFSQFIVYDLKKFLSISNKLMERVDKKLKETSK